MCSLTEGKWNHAVTSSMDRTIKVWDLSTILEDVHPLDRQENEILSVLSCEVQGMAVTMTRSGMGLWDLRTGRLLSTFSRARVGAVITASALSSDCRTLVMAESDHVYVWNLRHRAILFSGREPDVLQILFSPDEQRFLTSSHMKVPGSQPSTLVVARSLPFGDIAWTLEFAVRKFLPVVITTDEHYLVSQGVLSSPPALLSRWA